MSQNVSIAAILFRHLGEALLKVAAELDNGGSEPKAIATTIKQVPEKPLSTAPSLPKVLNQHPYKPEEKVLVLFDGASLPIKCTILECINEDTFIVHQEGAPKKISRDVRRNQIVGMQHDSDRKLLTNNLPPTLGELS